MGAEREYELTLQIKILEAVVQLMTSFRSSPRGGTIALDTVKSEFNELYKSIRQGIK